MHDLRKGLYEQVINRALASLIDAARAQGQTAHVAPLDPGEAHVVLASYMERLIGEALREVDGKDKLACQVQVCNEIIAHLRPRARGDDLAPDSIQVDAQQLRAIIERADALSGTEPRRPDTPLASGCLLTGTHLDPSLLTQLRKEIAAADQVDILCSFIKWGGVRVLADELRAFTARPSAVLRIITTSYMGATDLKAVEFLRALPNTTIKVSYDTSRTRLHAKAYVIQRATGFGSAYVGSANISQAALTDGLEWVVKISQYESPHLWDKVAATFETYWNDGEFVTYEHTDRPRLQLALQQERGPGDDGASLPNFDLRPYQFQQEILDAIAAERSVQDRHKHLIVAATGTGKTIVAGFDYRNFANEWRRNGRHGLPRLLFVAHREEILRQSRNVFRAVLRDQNFGDLLVGDETPISTDALFVSIQSYNSKNLSAQFAPSHFDYIVVDEFHHAAAPSYGDLLDHVRPQELLGLTATPERADGLDVLHRFDDHITAEIRLPDAVNRKLLAPFQYFCITDHSSASLDALQWTRGGYRISDLGKVYTGNDARAQLVIDKVRQIVLEVGKAKGLGFCVSVEHAQYMAAQFNRAGIRSEALSAESPDALRRTIQSRLRQTDINFIFVVDLYNEGVDIPEVDTVLFLRPTESLTVFLQQLGRGLRLCDGKDCLTVLDFVAQAHQNYRFDLKFKALLARQPHSLVTEIEQGLPHLPAGCMVHMERVAQQYILENVRRQISQNRNRLIEQLRTFQADTGRVPTLANFLDHYHLDPDDLYRRRLTWSRMRVEAGIASDFAETDEPALARGFRRIQHIDDPAWIRWLLATLDPAGATRDPSPATTPAESHWAMMLHFSIWGRHWLPEQPVESLDRLRRSPVLCSELIELLRYRLDGIRSIAPALELPFECPLSLHAQYTRDEILAGLGVWTMAEQREVREGVLHVPAIKADAFFVTLNKAETDYSPSTMYEDYAISESLFHWQSQSTTSEQSPTGQRYIRHRDAGNTILLFVRESKKQNNLACPYAFLGPADYVSHTGSRPMSITWRLRHPMPARLLRTNARLAVG